MVRADALPVDVGACTAALVREEHAPVLPDDARVARVHVARLDPQVAVATGAEELLDAGRLEDERGPVLRGAGHDQDGKMRIPKRVVDHGIPQLRADTVGATDSSTGPETVSTQAARGPR